jgi:hypothetical protein
MIRLGRSRDGHAGTHHVAASDYSGSAASDRKWVDGDADMVQTLAAFLGQGPATVRPSYGRRSRRDCARVEAVSSRTGIAERDDEASLAQLRQVVVRDADQALVFIPAERWPDGEQAQELCLASGEPARDEDVHCGSVEGGDTGRGLAEAFEGAGFSRPYEEIGCHLFGRALRMLR